MSGRIEKSSTGSTQKEQIRDNRKSRGYQTPRLGSSYEKGNIMLNNNSSIYDEAYGSSVLTTTSDTLTVSRSDTLKTQTGWGDSSLSIVELKAFLTKHMRCDNKEAAKVFFPGSLIDGQRKKTSVKSISMLVYDVDEASNISTSINIIREKKLQAFIYSTFSHAAEKPKMRVVLPLRDPFIIERSSEQSVRQSGAIWGYS